MVLWDGLQPTDVEIVEAFYKRTLLFPRERVLAVCPRLARWARSRRCGPADRPACSCAT